MTNIEVNYGRREYVTRRATEDQWDRDDTAADISVYSISRKAEIGYRDISVGFDVVPGQNYWLLWADYNTGDSFGRDENIVEFIDLYQSPEAAEKAKKELSDKAGYSLPYTRDDGDVVSIHIPWEGYFESLNSLNITMVECVS